MFNPNSNLRRWLGLLLAGLVAGSFTVLMWSRLYCEPQKATLVSGVASSRSTIPATFEELIAAPASEIEHCDIALMNSLCSEGLPGAEDLIVTNSLFILDEWAKHVRSETERNFHRYRDNPANFHHSEGYFGMLMMAVVMYEDFGIRYNPNRITMPGKIDPNDRFFANAQDIFLNGLIKGQRMGTCSSMPVLYIAIGRRLGYPLKLVTTKAHLFVRWQSDTDYFNVEATGKGMNRYDDEHFKQWPFPVTEAEMQTEGFLKSLTASEELAVFLSLRGNCLKAAGRMTEASECYASASRLAPTWNAYRALLADTAESGSSSLSASKYVAPTQTQGTFDAALPKQTVSGPDPNPLKQMNGQ